METKLNKSIASVFVTVLFFVISTATVFASSAELKLSPQTKNVKTEETFTVSLDISADTNFNAAKATVLISSILSIEDITLGDCNFSFVKTPSKSQPSFVGVILGGYTKQCHVYTLTLKANRSGVASINLFDTSVIGYEKSVNMPISVHNGAYTISGTSQLTNILPTPIEPPLIDAQGNKLYTINYTLPIPANTPPSSLNVVLQMTPSGNQVNTPISNPQNPSTATVVFENVPEGVHTITTKKEDKPIASQIVNVAGESRHLSFGTSEKQESPLIWYAIAVVSVLVVSFIAFVIYWRYNKNRFTPEI